jgi:hypothetical protein
MANGSQIGVECWELRRDGFSISLMLNEMVPSLARPGLFGD